MDMNSPDCVIGIDPGKSGGIAVIDRTGLSVIPMPETKVLYDYLKELEGSHRKVIAVIERVGIYKTDNDEPGMRFRIVTMVENYTTCRVLLEIAGIEYRTVESRTWQGALRLSGKRGEKKTERKNRYREFASALFPDVKLTLATSDAVCLAIYAYKNLDVNK